MVRARSSEERAPTRSPVCAWAIAKPGMTLTEDDLRDALKGQIAHFKIPRHFRIVNELPMTITGKPQKFVMRDKMVEMLG